MTPIRALLEELTTAREDVVVIYRVSDRRGAVLVEEMQWLAHQCGTPLHVVTGASAPLADTGRSWDHGTWPPWYPASNTATSTCADRPA